MEDLTRRLPLGTVVILNGGIQKLMIISRGMVIQRNGKQYLFEYGGCIYPQGLVSDKLLYFNNEDISEIIFEGYSDEDNDRMVNNLDKWTEEKNFEKGSVSLLNNR